jgi:hypothetical protein
VRRGACTYPAFLRSGESTVSLVHGLRWYIPTLILPARCINYLNRCGTAFILSMAIWRLAVVMHTRIAGADHLAVLSFFWICGIGNQLLIALRSSMGPPLRGRVALWLG